MIHRGFINNYCIICTSVPHKKQWIGIYNQHHGGSVVRSSDMVAQPRMFEHIFGSTQKNNRKLGIFLTKKLIDFVEKWKKIIKLHSLKFTNNGSTWIFALLWSYESILNNTRRRVTGYAVHGRLSIFLNIRWKNRLILKNING